ncbi:hypothetical protein [Patiriisocius hiemis]|uniref:Exo-alpha-sialidase n=1 Tax=Patiriisocius hiemis TaxID=3075604 RepID=A0ABU2YA87_9FLAO|nr:hypothetical protein [Constantimarinum sp. W242]MDT0555099.1 hypothetical protein [Constantimarinum sp. W242]
MRYFIFIIITSLFFACKEKPSKKTEVSSEESLELFKESFIPTFSNPANDSNSSLPRLFSTGNQLYMSWVTQQDSLATLYYSAYENGEWLPKQKVTSGTDWFVNWADFPAIAVNNETVLSNILQKSADGTYTYDIKLNLGIKVDTILKENFTLHSDGTKSEHGFVSIVPLNDGAFSVTWLDGRNTTGGHGEGKMTLRNATVNYNGLITERIELDSSVCDCCNTAMAMTQKGPIVAYRDRSEEEIRDISIIRKSNSAWTSPYTIGKDNWKIAGCPVNGPAIAALDATVVVAWFTSANGEGDVKVAFSKDNGATFGTPFRVDGTNALGRVGVALLDESRAVVTWMEPNGEDAVIKLMEINDHGYTQPSKLITKTKADRASGFPQLARIGDSLFVAWTSIRDDSKTVNIARLDSNNL